MQNSLKINLGQAFIETKNLDGETNLKHKSVPKGLAKGFKGTNEEVIYINFHLSDSEFSLMSEIKSF